jgi:hypothetical protein
MGDFSIPSLIGDLPIYAEGLIEQDYADEASRELGGLQATLRDRVAADYGATYSAIKVDQNLSPVGKTTKIEIAAKAGLTEVDRLMQTSPRKWRGKVKEMTQQIAAKLPGLPPDGVLAGQIRDFLRSLPRPERAAFVLKHADDQAVAGVVLHSPRFLLGEVSDETLDLFRKAVVASASPETQARIDKINQLLKAVDTTAAAVRKSIRQSAGLLPPADEQAA